MDHDWTELPKHLLDSVIKKLKSSMDFLQCGCVCLSWHSVMLKDNQVMKQKKRTQVPLLLVPNLNDQHIWRIYDVMADKYLKSTLSIPYGKRFCGSSQGWLVFVNNDWSVSLHNPFSNQHSTIRLPCLFPPDLEDDYNVDITQVYDYHIFKAYITRDPATNPDECMVIVIFEEFSEVAFIKLTQETEWTVIKNESMTGIEDIIQYKKKLYCVDDRSQLISFDINDSKKPIVKRVTKTSSYVIDRKSYIVEVDGNLLQVERIYTYDGLPDCKRRDTLEFIILQLDFRRKKWREIDSLGDYSLFLGVNSSVSVKASDVMGCRHNCIYFTHDVDTHITVIPVVCDLGIFDIQSKEFVLGLNIDSSALNMMTTRPPIWIVPTFNIN